MSDHPSDRDWYGGKYMQVVSSSTNTRQVFRDGWDASAKAQPKPEAQPPGERYWKAEHLAGNEEIERLKRENGMLRHGMKGDYDLDAWLDWTKEVAAAQPVIDSLETIREAMRYAAELLPADETTETHLWRVAGALRAIESACIHAAQGKAQS